MFFDIFEQLCKRKGVSCKRAVIEMGLSHSIATKWKKTGAMPEGATLVKVANYFNVPVALLVESVEGDNTADLINAIDAQVADDIKDGKRVEFTDDDLKFALWGDTSIITDADLEDVRKFAAFIKQKREQEGSK